MVCVRWLSNCVHSQWTYEYRTNIVLWGANRSLELEYTKHVSVGVIAKSEDKQMPRGSTETHILSIIICLCPYVFCICGALWCLCTRTCHTWMRGEVSMHIECCFFWWFFIKIYLRVLRGIELMLVGLLSLVRLDFEHEYR